MRIFAKKQKPQQLSKPVNSSTHNRTGSPQGQTAQSIPHLLRTIGNQGIQQLLHTNVGEVETVSTDFQPTCLIYNLAHIPNSNTRYAHTQQKLRIGFPGEINKREADNTADHLMRMPDRKPQKTATVGSTRTAAFEESVRAIQGTGSPLPETTRCFFESRFGADFSNVRIHTDSNAEHLARQVNAKAFTLGKDLVFASGQYSPETPAGKHLLAHELTHVIQQRGTEKKGKYQRQAAPAATSVVRKTTTVVPIAPMTSAALKIQRKIVKSHWGKFETLAYNPLKKRGKKIGVVIHLVFHPDRKVNAKKIGFTQVARGLKLGKVIPHWIHGRSAATGPAKGYFVDRPKGFPSPIYHSKRYPRKGGKASEIADYPTTPKRKPTRAEMAQYKKTGVTGFKYIGFSTYGAHYTSRGTTVTKNAEMYDVAAAGGTNDTSQIFETTVLAIEGAQKNTYYGSVRWGYKIDSIGNFTPEPFTLVSEGVPSAIFLTAAKHWNLAKVIVNQQYLFTKTQTSLKNAAGKELTKVPPREKLKPTGDGKHFGNDFYYEVIYVFRTRTFKGYVHSNHVSVGQKMSTLDLPIPNIYKNIHAIGTLPIGQRLRLIKKPTATAHGEVEVVQGKHTGTKIKITKSQMKNLQKEKP